MPFFSFFKSSKGNSRRPSESDDPRPARSDFVSRRDSTYGSKTNYLARSDFGPRPNVTHYRPPIHGKSPAAAAARRRAHEEAMRRQDESVRRRLEDRDDGDSYESGDSLDLESSDDIGSLRLDELRLHRRRASIRHDAEPPSRRQFRHAKAENRDLVNRVKIMDLKLQRVEAKIKAFEDKSALRQAELAHLRLRDLNHREMLNFQDREEKRLTAELRGHINNIQLNHPAIMNTPPNTQPRGFHQPQMPMIPQNAFVTPPAHPPPPRPVDSANSRGVHTETTGSPFSPRTPINPQMMQRVFQGDLWGQIGAMSRPRSAAHLPPHPSAMALTGGTPKSRQPMEGRTPPEAIPKTPSTIPIDQMDASPQPGPSRHNAANQTPPSFPGDPKSLLPYQPTPPIGAFNPIPPSLFSTPPDYCHLSASQSFSASQTLNNTSQSLHLNNTPSRGHILSQSAVRNHLAMTPLLPGMEPPLHSFPMANFFAQLPTCAEDGSYDRPISEVFSALSDVAEEPRSSWERSALAESAGQLLPLERIDEVEEALERSDSSMIANLKHVDSEESDKENRIL